MNTILIRPFAKARPRAHIVNGKIATYMDKDYKAKKAACTAALRAANHTPLAGPVCLTLVFQYSKGPFSDVDNLAGGFMDAANGLLWGDDKQVTELHVTRRKGDADAILYEVEAVDG